MVALVAVQEHNAIPVEIADTESEALHIKITRRVQVRCAKDNVAQAQVSRSEAGDSATRFKRSSGRRHAAEQLEMIPRRILTPDERINLASLTLLARRARRHHPASFDHC